MTFNQIIVKSHDQSKKYGFWDNEHHKDELVMAIVGECCKALEAYNKGYRFDQMEYTTGFNLYSNDNLKHKFGSGWPIKAAFERYVDSTFEGRLSSSVVLIADLLGSTGYQYDEKTFKIPLDTIKPNIETKVATELREVVRWISAYSPRDGRGNDGRDTFMMSGVAFLFSIANSLEIDLWKFIEMRLTYNEAKASA